MVPPPETGSVVNAEFTVNPAGNVTVSRPVTALGNVNEMSIVVDAPAFSLPSVARLTWVDAPPGP